MTPVDSFILESAELITQYAPKLAESSGCHRDFSAIVWIYLGWFSCARGI